MQPKKLLELDTRRENMGAGKQNSQSPIEQMREAKQGRETSEPDGAKRKCRDLDKS